MSTQHVRFLGSLGATLAGRIELPESQPRGWALFAHCFTCSKDSKGAVEVCRALVGTGFGVLRFDFTGLGESGGDFAHTDFSSNVGDLVAAADWLRGHYGPPTLMIGHSLGGAATLAAVHRVPDCTAVATIGAPFDPAHVTRQLGPEIDEIKREGEATVQLGGRAFKVRREFLEDIASQQLAGRIRELRRPLLILHAPNDTIVPIENAAEIFRAALHPKSFVSLDQSGHLLLKTRDARYAANVIATWADRYVLDNARQVVPGTTGG